MSKLTNDLFNLTAAQRKALKARIQLDARLNCSSRLIQITSREANIPLSFAQQRLWFLDQLIPGTAAYNLPGALRIRGPLSLIALQQSLDEIVRRHESLRTRFICVDERPIQCVMPAELFPLTVIDLRRLPESERDAEAQRLADEEAARPFNITADPLVRTKLLRLGNEHFIFLYTMHHIASDGWSMEIFNRELTGVVAG
jgi:hypothetical protein